MSDLPEEAVIAEALARALTVDDPESLGLSRGEGSLHIALSIRVQEVIEDVYADCGDSAPSVLAANIGQRLAHLLPAAILTAAAPIIRADERKRIAEEIRVEMRRHDTAQTGFSAIGDAYANAARIAERGGQ